MAIIKTRRLLDTKHTTFYFSNSRKLKTLNVFVVFVVGKFSGNFDSLGRLLLATIQET